MRLFELGDESTRSHERGSASSPALLLPGVGLLSFAASYHGCVPWKLVPPPAESSARMSVWRLSCPSSVVALSDTEGGERWRDEGDGGEPRCLCLGEMVTETGVERAIPTPFRVVAPRRASHSWWPHEHRRTGRTNKHKAGRETRQPVVRVQSSEKLWHPTRGMQKNVHGTYDR